MPARNNLLIGSSQVSDPGLLFTGLPLFKLAGASRYIPELMDPTPRGANINDALAAGKVHIY